MRELTDRENHVLNILRYSKALNDRTAHVIPHMEAPFRVQDFLDDIIVGGARDDFLFRMPYPAKPLCPVLPVCLMGWVTFPNDEPVPELTRRMAVNDLESGSPDFEVAARAAAERLGIADPMILDGGRVDGTARRQCLLERADLLVAVRFEDDPAREEQYENWKSALFASEIPEALTGWVRRFDTTKDGKKTTTWESRAQRMLTFGKLSDTERECVWARSGDIAFPVFDEQEPEIDFKADPQRAAEFKPFMTEYKEWLDEVKRVERIQRAFMHLSNMETEVQGSNMRKEIVFGEYVLSVRETRQDEEGRTKRIALEYPVIVATAEIGLAERDATEDDEPLVEVRLKAGEFGKLQTQVFRAIKDADEHSLTEWERAENTGQFLPGMIEMEERTENVRKNARRVRKDCLWAEDDAMAPTDESTFVRLARKPVVFVRDRDVGLVQAIDKMIKAVEENVARIPESVCVALCGHDESKPQAEEVAGFSHAESLRAASGIDEELFFAKPANEDQIKIAKLVERKKAVLVQGPPGTGKTHTIANLITHYLTKGKRILVVSSKAPALRVLRDKLPEEVRPLCLSWLGDIEENQTLLKAFIDRLDEREMEDRTKTQTKIETMRKKRAKLLTRRHELEQMIVANRLKEMAMVALHGEQYSLSRLAKELREEVQYAEVIPGTVSLDGPLPLTEADLTHLHKTHARWKAEEVHELLSVLPPLAALPLPEDVRAWSKAQLKRQTALSSVGVGKSTRNANLIHFVVTYGRGRTNRAPTDWEMPVWNIGKLVELIEDDGKWPVFPQDPDRPWEHIALLAGYEPKEETAKVVEAAIRDIEEMAVTNREVSDQLFGHTFEGLDNLHTPEFEAALAWGKAQPDGALSGGMSRFMKGLFNRSKLELLESVQVDGKPAITAEAFRLLDAKKAFDVRCRKFAQRWTTVYAPRLRLPEDAVGEETKYADLVTRYANSLRHAYGWKGSRIDPMIWAWEELDVDMAKLVPHRDTMIPSERLEMFETICKQLRHVKTGLLDFVDAEKAAAERKSAVEALEVFVEENDLPKPYVPVMSSLHRGLVGDAATYEAAYERLRKIELEEVPEYRRREDILRKLRKWAPTWAEVFSSETQLPVEYVERDYETWRMGWLYAQKEAVFKANASEDLQSLLEEEKTLYKEILNITSKLASSLAWESVHATQNQMGALRQAKDNLRRVGKGTGAQAETFRTAARRNLDACRDVVPVWVMPIDSAITHFEPKQKFDLVILDEASQAEVSLFPILLMGERIVVVGDQNQVSPMATLDNDDAKAARRQFLGTLLNADTRFTASSSVYDVAASYWPNVMLREHFRCVPDIIEFSSRLSYEGKIRPLRSADSTNLRTPFVLERVNGVRDDKDVNEVEAERIVRLIKGMLQQEEYAEKTIGVIVMRSGKAGNQEKLISQRIVEFIPPKLQKKHEIRVGTSSDFQGDERDVIILSLVDSPNIDLTKPDAQVFLRLEGEGSDAAQKKRWNVAVSRAREQVWVVHSFDWEKGLRDKDLRRRLFEHIAQIGTKEENMKTALENADPNSQAFEAPVAAELLNRGYRVLQQYKVGGYRIDMVVEGGDKTRIALECDGERYHTEDNLREDMARQAVLERIGWTFIRLRGSEYFRNPVKAIDRVCEDLKRLGVEPIREKLIVEKDGLPDRVRVAAMDDEHSLMPKDRRSARVKKAEEVKKAKDAAASERTAPEVKPAPAAVKSKKVERTVVPGTGPVITTEPPEQPTLFGDWSTQFSDARRPSAAEELSAYMKEMAGANNSATSVIGDENGETSSDLKNTQADELETEADESRDWTEVFKRPNTDDENARLLACREMLREIHDFSDDIYADIAKAAGITSSRFFTRKEHVPRCALPTRSQHFMPSG